MSTTDTAVAMVLESFGEPLVPKEYPVPEVEVGALLAQVTAAGICGSDLDISGGDDPRIKLPLIIGHHGNGHPSIVTLAPVDSVRGGVVAFIAFQSQFPVVDLIIENKRRHVI